MEITRGRNSFLTSLLALQQDGRHAISAPTNWTHEPLLDVPTEVDAVVGRLSASLVIGQSANEIAEWHFFIGSPGNGKSAAIGKLCRDLISKRNCTVRDESGVSISELEPTAMPYAMRIYEDGKPFASAILVQDASVVRNPYSATVDPAKELIDTLRSAWEKGMALVVCTNRGVLEKAHRDFHMNHEVNTSAWFKVISSLVNAPGMHDADQLRDFDSKKPVFRRLKIGFTFLDNRSLLLGRSTFAELVKKATDESKWEACVKCPAIGTCPFRANRDWLAFDSGSEKVVQLLKRAEMLSGQVIVFREALALISLLLAGCPQDYGETHPCDWVQERIEASDLFSLISRRIYMCLFAASGPFGLERASDLLSKQLEALSTIRGTLPQGSGKARAALDHVVGGIRPSTDVGVARLLGPNGIMANLDPCKESLPASFYDKWDADLEALPADSTPYFCDLERACISIWKTLEAALELSSDIAVPGAYWSLRRWVSNCIMHLGALSEGLTAWPQELDRFELFLTLLSKPVRDRTAQDKIHIKQLDDRLKALLDDEAVTSEAGRVRLTESVTLSGQWVNDRLRPKLISSQTFGGVSLAVQFDGREGAVFGAPVFLWLTRRAEGRLDARCFPQELMAGIEDARIRAAAKSEYAFADDDVELLVVTGTGEQLVLNRIDGEVSIGSK